eukprot:Colp12_sorted_trinity150504_noHs@4511
MSSFQANIAAGLSSETFDLTHNVSNQDNRKGLDNADEVKELMEKNGVTFDEARLILTRQRMLEHGIDPDTGCPIDTKVVTFSSVRKHLKKQGQVTQASSKQEKIAALCKLGFSEDQCWVALKKFDGDPMKAGAWLLEEELEDSERERRGDPMNPAVVIRRELVTQIRRRQYQLKKQQKKFMEKYGHEFQVKVSEKLHQTGTVLQGTQQQLKQQVQQVKDKNIGGRFMSWMRDVLAPPPASDPWAAPEDSLAAPAPKQPIPRRPVSKTYETDEQAARMATLVVTDAASRSGTASGTTTPRQMLSPAASSYNELDLDEFEAAWERFSTMDPSKNTVLASDVWDAFTPCVGDDEDAWTPDVDSTAISGTKS